MKSIILISYSFLCLFCNAQNEAYYLSEGGMDLKRVDLDSCKIIDYHSFLDTIVLKTTPSDDLTVFTEQNHFLSRDSSQIIASFVPRGMSSSDNPYFKTVNDSINVNDKWHKIEIIQTDDHFVGGSPNRMTADIIVKDLGVIYSHSNWVDTHADIMICHQDSIKQMVLTTAFEHIEKNHPFVIEKTRLARIISLTKEYNFNHLIDTLSERWLAPRQDLKLIQSNSEVVNGQINYTVVIKNISNKRYCFLAESEFGPATLEHLRNDKRLKGGIDGNGHGTRYHYNFKKTNIPIYLNPGEEVSFTLNPNWRENCGGCNENKYSGFQVYRYGVDFYYWIFSKEIESNNHNYTLYHLREIN